MSNNMFTGGNEGYAESGGYVSKMIPHPSATIVNLKKVEVKIVGKNKTPLMICIFTAVDETEGLSGDYGAHQYARNEFWLTPKAMVPTALGSCIKFFSLLAENMAGPDTAEFQKAREKNLHKWNKKCMDLEDNDWDAYAAVIMEFFEGKEFAAVIAGHWETDPKDANKTYKKSLLNYKGTFARTVGELDTLKEYVENNKDYLIQDDTVKNTAAGIGTPERSLEGDDSEDW